MHSDLDVMSVRADEQFDYHAMQTYLHTHVAHTEGSLEVRQFGGGHANLTYLLSMSAQEWVMRRPPLGPTLPTAHDMRREFRVLSALATTDVPVPRPVRLCEDSSVIGVPFYLMERRRGIVIRDAIPPEIGDDLDKRRQVSEATVRPWRPCMQSTGRQWGYRISGVLRDISNDSYGAGQSSGSVPRRVLYRPLNAFWSGCDSTCPSHRAPVLCTVTTSSTT